MEVLLSNYTRRNRKEILASLKACVHPLPPHKKQSPMARLTVAWSESVCKLRAIHVNASSLSDFRKVNFQPRSWKKRMVF